MPAALLDGKALAAELRAELGARAGRLRERGVQPALAVVLVGEEPSSLAYLRALEKLGAAVGIRVATYRLPENAPEGDVESALEAIARDRDVHGVILQQPLPAHLSARRIAEFVPIEKDADAVHPLSFARLARAGEARFVPATPAAAMALLERSAKWPIRGREVVVVGRSQVVGLPVALLALAADATVTIAHSRTPDLAQVLRRAEIVIAAIGRPRAIAGAWLRPGATVIDVGTSIVDGAVVGDVADDAKEVAAEITPVPGGVGPVTNVMLMCNVVGAAERAFPARD